MNSQTRLDTEVKTANPQAACAWCAQPATTEYEYEPPRVVTRKGKPAVRIRRAVPACRPCRARLERHRDEDLRAARGKTG